MPTPIKPRALSRTSTLAIVATSFAVEPERVRDGERQLCQLGFRTVHREDLFERCDYFAGADARRLTELASAIRDPDVDGILCARGGYGCTRLLPSLDPREVREARKVLAGYSDVTSLLLWQWKCAGLVGFHAPMLDREGGLGEAELASLRDALVGAAPEVDWPGEPGLPGRADGILLGGSLTLVSGSLGTPWEVDLDGAILMIEEVGEKPYAIDRMLAQLAAAGKFEGLAGVGVGHLVECTDRKRARPSAREVIERAFGPLGVPVVFGLPFGHASPNLTWPLGVRARVDGDAGTLRILEGGVEKS